MKAERPMLGLVHVASSEQLQSIAFPPHQTTQSDPSVIRNLRLRCIPHQCAKRKDEKKKIGLSLLGRKCPWRSERGFQIGMTGSNGREVEQSVTALRRINHVNHKKGGQFESLAVSCAIRTISFLRRHLWLLLYSTRVRDGN